jgi:predicted enzyme related to lactoylglutathione lyase
MPERTSYEPGTPSWVDLGTSDPDASRAFYGELFGWTADEPGPVEETGGYAMFRKDGKLVAGVGPLQGAGQPVAWSTYVSTDDLDGLARRARDAGATMMVEPMQIMDAGRMAFFGHEAVGAIGAWEPGRHKGAELVNEPGSLSWNELHTTDLEAAKAFAGAVFGWSAAEWDMGGGPPYTIFNLGENGIAGATGVIQEGAPSHWLVIFAVDDADASVAKVRELGGSVVVEPMDAEGVGRFAIVTDPQGATFGVIKNAPRP